MLFNCYHLLKTVARPLFWFDPLGLHNFKFLTTLGHLGAILQNLFTATAQLYNCGYILMVDTWLTEFRIDRICVVLQKGYILYV